MGLALRMASTSNELENESDKAIIARVLEGQINQFELLLLKYQSRIYSLILRQVVEVSTAEDLTQEVFLKAFTALRSYRAEASFSTWITRIALNVSASYFNSRAYKIRSKAVMGDKALGLLKAEEQGQTLQIERELQFLRMFLGELKPRYREVLVLCCLEQKSYLQAAEILGIPIGTVGSRINTGIKILRDKFNKTLKNE